MIAVRGRIESGGAFGMLGGGWERTGASDSENLSVEEACSAAIDDWRGRVCEERYLECIVIAFLTGKVHFVDPAICKEVGCDDEEGGEIENKNWLRKQLMKQLNEQKTAY